MNNNVYENCIPMENSNFLVRLLKQEDFQDLFRIYSDVKAVPFFNHDNCHGDDFYYNTEEKMQKGLSFWLFSYEHSYFVRYSIIDKKTNHVIGTFEVYHRDAKESLEGLDAAFVRLDLRSDYENKNTIKEVFSLTMNQFLLDFQGKEIITKNFAQSPERMKALLELGFVESKDFIIGFDGTKYGSYYIKK